MTNEKQDYFATLKQAQELGYAEADPTFDVEGIDSAHKITILSSLASASLPNFNMFIEGISKLSDLDIVIADELGYKIKLLAIYKNFGDSIEQTVYPALIAKNEKIAQIDGSYNCVLTLGNNCEYNMMIGRGAGGLTTGSAVVADIVDIACNRQNDLLFNSQLADLKTVKIKDIKTRIGKYFIKFNFTKNHLGEKKFVENNFKKIFNIEKIIYKKINDEQFVCGLITDNIKEQDLLDSLADIDSSIINQLSFLRVEETKF